MPRDNSPGQRLNSVSIARQHADTISFLAKTVQVSHSDAQTTSFCFSGLPCSFYNLQFTFYNFYPASACVTRSTSAIVVVPARTFRAPSIRSVCIPSSSAFFLTAPVVNQLANFFRNNHQFINSGSAAIAGLKTFGTAGTGIKFNVFGNLADAQFT
jgi:hypothetical protein